MDSTPSFSLTLIRDALSHQWFARKDYLALFKEISAPTANRDLKVGRDSHLLEQTGEGNQAMYRFLESP